MNGSFLDWLKLNKTIAIQCIAVFGIGIIVTGLVPRLKGKISLPTEGFDFNARKHDASSGPTIGETIDLKVPKGRDGRSLAEVVGNSPFCMIAVVDPHCPACKAAESEMSGVNNRLTNAGIPYFIMILGSTNSASEYFAYADSLNLSSKAFIWRTDESQPPPSLHEMVIPSHLLLSRDGVVVDKWPGTHQDPVVRQRMMNQITADALKRIGR